MDTETLRACVDAGDFGDTVAQPLTDIWKKQSFLMQLKPKPRGQADGP